MAAVLILGGAATLLLAVNAALSAAQRRDSVLTAMRLNFAILAAVATLVLVNLVRVLGW